MRDRVVSPPLTDIDRLRQPLTDGERFVLEYFLATLPQSWEIYIQPHLNGLRPDFVLLNEERGIAVFEVKDWNLDAMDYYVETRAKSGPKLMARRDGKSFLIEQNNPVTKIDLYKEEIYSLYCPRLPSGQGFGVITAGIIFPFASDEAVCRLLAPLQHYYGHDEHPTLYPLVGRDTLMDRSELTIKRKVLPSISRLDDRISRERAADLRHWLVEPEFSGEQRRPLMDDLSAAQRKLATTRTASGFRRIKGAAGSGKTFILAARAAILAAEEKNVLVITFNITLINYILDMAVRFAQSGKVRSQIVALNFHAWCKRVALASGHYSDYQELWKGEDAGGVLKSGMARAAREWLSEVGEEEKWDAILVDEGQDFELEWWIALRQALKPGGEAMLCADNAQNIYEVQSWTEEEMKGAGFRGEWGTLAESFRLSPSLCKLANQFVARFLPESGAQRPLPIEGELEFKTILKWWQVPQESAADYCMQAMEYMVEESDPPISYADLTCIAENEAVGLKIVESLKRRGINAIHTFGQGDSPAKKYYDGQRKKQAFFKGDARVKVTTVHSFKGWESKALVVHIGHGQSEAALSLAYAGITRLKRDDHGCYLTVVCSARELVEYGKTWPEFQDLRATSLEIPF